MTRSAARRGSSSARTTCASGPWRRPSMPGLRSAVLLAAGEGTKAWPYNEARNKCAFPVVTVPAVRRLATTLIDLGVDRLVVILGAGEASVRHALRGLPVAPQFISRPSMKGTAPAALAGLEA